MSGSPAAGAADLGVVLAAAGAGRRFGAKKQLLSLAGRPLLDWSLEAFEAVAVVAEIVVAAPSEDLAEVERLLAARPAWPGSRKAVAGGARRQDSVLAGLRALGAGCEFALVHDAARPLIRAAEIEALALALRQHGSAVLGHPAVDSVKEADAEGRIARDLPRERVWQVQTPQGARRRDLLRALENAAARGLDVTDEAGALEASGIRPLLVEGPRENLKITFAADIPRAEWILAQRAGGANA